MTKIQYINVGTRYSVQYLPADPSNINLVNQLPDYLISNCLYISIILKYKCIYFLTIIIIILILTSPKM